MEGLYLGIYVVKENMIQLPIFSPVPLNDGGWYKIELGVQTTSVEVTISSNGSNCNPFCTIATPYPVLFGNITLPFSGLLTFGNVPAASNISQSLVNNFSTNKGISGCIRHLMYDQSLQNLEEGLVSEYPVDPGCPRDEYCQPNPCGNEGLCIASWEGYSCQCGIDYAGNNCTEGKRNT